MKVKQHEAEQWAADWRKGIRSAKRGSRKTELQTEEGKGT